MSDRDERELEDEELEEGQEEVEDHENASNGGEDDKAGAVAEPEEELPDEKPFDGEIEMDLHAGGVHRATVRFAGEGVDPGSLPVWLPYLVNDDAFWFDRCLKGLSLPSNGKTEGADDAEAEGDEGAAAGDGGDDENADGGDAAPAGGDEDDDDGDDSSKPRVDVNARFVLAQSIAGGDLFICRPYVPPVPVEGEGEGEGEGDENAEGAEGAEGDAADGDDAAEEAEEATSSRGGDGKVDDGAAEEEEEETKPAEVIVDALTLAALLSRECLALALAQPNVSFKHLCDFASEGFVAGNRAAINAVLDAVAKRGDESGKPAPRRAVDFNWLIKAHNVAAGDAHVRDEAAAAATAKAATNYMGRLLDANVVPDAPINPAHLRTAASVNAYVTLLLTMPKSMLQQWAKPLPDEEGNEPGDVPEEVAEEAALATNSPVARFVVLALLDLRRRNARECKGKVPLREAPIAAHKRTIAVLKACGGGDQGADTVAAPQFAQRSYYPQVLQLRMSDLLAAALGRHDYAVDSFKEALALRMGVAGRTADTPFGLPALLFQSMATHLSPLCLAAVVDMANPEWFAPKGLVDIKQWAADGLAAKPMVFDNDAQRFAQRFGRYFVADERVLASTEDSSLALYERLREVERFTESAARELAKPAGCDTSALDTALERCGPSLVCTPALLEKAATARNKEGVCWLVAQGVADVALPGTSQTCAVLEYVVMHLRDADLTLFLVQLGADLSAVWHGGATSGVCAVQDTFSGDDAETILGAFHAREAERLTDPRCKVGLLRACAA